MTRVNIRHGIRLIRQPIPSNVCWAAATAMTVGGSASIASVQSAATAANVRIQTNGSLPLRDLANTRTLAGAFRLQVVDVQSTPVTLENVLKWLRRGRFAMLGGFNYTSRTTALDHAVTFYGARGDGSNRRTTVLIADPQGGLFQDDWEHFEEQIMADPHFVMHK
jgi:hypothetical protein